MRRELTRVNGYFEVTIPAYSSGEFENHFRMTRESCQLLTRNNAHWTDTNWQFIWAPAILPDKPNTAVPWQTRNRIVGSPTGPHYCFFKCPRQFTLGKLRPVPNVVLLPCRTQMNLARQRHDDSTTAVSNVEPNTVEPNSKDKTNHPSSGKICQ